MKRQEMRLPNILIVSVIGASKRRKFMQKELDKLSVNYEFFNATEGVSLNKEWLDSNVDLGLQRVLFKKWTAQFALNTIACADSHRRVQRLIAEQVSEDYFMVLEDDAILEPDFLRSWQEIQSAMINFGRDILFIGYSMSKGGVIGSKLMRSSNDYGLYEYPDIKIAGAFGYVVNRRGAEMLLQPNDILIMDTADTWNIRERSMERYVAVLGPKAVSTGYLTTSIGYQKRFLRGFLVRAVTSIPWLRSLYGKRQRRSL